MVSSILFVGVSSAFVDFEDPQVEIASESEVQEEVSAEEPEEDLEEEKLILVLAAVEKAEEERTREALDSAYELINDLSEEPEDLRARLEVVESDVVVAEQVDVFINDLEHAERSPSRSRLNRLEEKAAKIEELDEDLAERLDLVRQEVEDEEERYLLAEEAIETAEADPNASTVEAATLAISALQVNRRTLTSRLEAVEETVTEQEKQAKREAEEKAAEEARRAEEEKAKAEAEAKAQAEAEAKAQAEAKAEAERKAAEQASAASSSSSQSSGGSSTQASSNQTGEAALLHFLNTASHGELQRVSHVAEKRATYIIEYRNANGPFTHSSQVMNVNQIGEGIYNNMKAMFNMN